MTPEEKDIVVAALEEWRECDCPWGPCDVYPHPAAKRLAEAIDRPDLHPEPL